MEKPENYEEQDEIMNIGAKSEKLHHRTLESALNVETPAPVGLGARDSPRGDPVRDSMDFQSGRNAGIFSDGYQKVLAPKKRQQERGQALRSSGTDQFSVASGGTHKKLDLRSSMATNTTAYTQGMVKSARGESTRHSKAMSGRRGERMQLQKYAEAYSFTNSSKNVTARQRYSLRNSFTRLPSKKKLGNHSSSSGLQYEMTLDSSRMRSPRNNMVDVRNGPGEHMVGSLVGFKKNLSQMPNSPIHAFGRQDTGRRPCNYDDRTPGTHTYSPEKLKLLSQTPRAMIGKSPRFDDSMVFRKNYANLPHAYLDNLAKKPKTNKMGVIGKDGRFKSTSMLSPGPGDYKPEAQSQLSARAARTLNNKLNQTHHAGFEEKSVTKKASQRSIGKQQMGVNQNEGHLFGTHYNRMHYFPEIDKDFKNREGPGPAKYELFSKISHGPGIQHSFTKTSRMIEARKSSEEPGPNSYKVEKYAQRVLSQYPVATRVPIGRAERNFDIRQYGAINSSAWSKGLQM